MEKISVTVRIPAIDSSCDFIIPDNMLLKDVLDLIVTILESEYSVSVNRQALGLLDMEDGKMLRPGYSLKQFGISDGARLILI